VAEMRAVKGDRELTWTDGVWGGDPELADLADSIAENWETIEIIPLGDLPSDDDSCEVVGSIMDLAFGLLDPSPGPIEKESDGMKTRTAHWGEYDASGRVY